MECDCSLKHQNHGLCTCELGQDEILEHLVSSSWNLSEEEEEKEEDDDTEEK